MNGAPPRVLLGPQRPTPNVAAGVEAAGVPEGPLAVISAGMQEAEGDLDHVARALGRSLVDLRLHQRAESLFAAETALHEAYRARQEHLQALQWLYRRRLRPLASAVRELYRTPGESELLAPERRHALAQLRALDQHHLGRVESAHRQFEQRFAPEDHQGLKNHMVEIATRLSACVGVLLTGGNVIVLLNRLRLFGLGRLLTERPLVAWSAGAMVLADRIVLYHDRTPQGRRDPEMLGAGLGLLPGRIFLPDSAHRLRRGDRLRTGMLARRFAPADCVTLDNGSLLHFQGQQLLASTDVRRISRGGKLEKVSAP